MTDTPPAITQPAATLVLLRDGASAPELFMQARAETMNFAAGMMVFPGGKVDEHDRELAASARISGGNRHDLDDTAARIAAVRESFEEAGVLLTRGAVIPEADFIAAGPAIAARNLQFGEFLARYDQHIDLDVLRPFARWVPPSDRHIKRFDTRFYLARLPQGAKAGHDGNEAIHSHWTTANDALARADSGQSKVIFPTRCNLARLAQFDTIDAIIDHARNTPVVRIQPELRTIDDETYLCIPEGIGYPFTRQALKQALRG